TPGVHARRQRSPEQTGRGRTRHGREDRENSSQPGDEKDGSCVAGRPRPDGREARSYCGLRQLTAAAAIMRTEAEPGLKIDQQQCACFGSQERVGCHHGVRCTLVPALALAGIHNRSPSYSSNGAFINKSTVETVL